MGLLIVILVGFGLTAGLKYWLPALGTRSKQQDLKNRWSAELKPTVGGIVFYLYFVFSIGVCFIDGQLGCNDPMVFLLCGSLAFGIGLWDDIKRISVSKKFIGQLLVATVFMFSHYHFHFFSFISEGNTLLELILNKAATFLIVVAFMNSVNMIDNMDGAAVVAVFPVMIAGGLHHNMVCMVMFCGMALVLLGFLMLNWNPAKVYMGDSGSMLLGYLCVLSILLMNRCDQTEFVDQAALVGSVHCFNDHIPIGALELILTVSLCSIFLTDTAVVVFNRWRHGASPTQGGCDHTTHNLNYIGLSPTKICVILFVFGICQVIIGFFLSEAAPYGLGGKFFKWHIIIYLFPSCAYFLTMLLISFRNLRKGKYSYIKK
ncbi:MAG: glycosyltransferase family 4 protein [Flavobacteriales bacterium]